MQIKNEILDKYSDLKLHLQEFESFVTVIIAAIRNEANPPTQIEINDALEILHQKIISVRKLSQEIELNS